MAKFDIPRRDGESPEDFRRRYHRAWERETRLAKGLPTRSPKQPCSVEGCEVLASAKGLCRCHYRIEWAKTRPTPKPGLRDHPLYMIWWERKNRGSLCEAWAMDFAQFLADVGQRPTDDHLLRPLRWNEPYGPENFHWLQALKRQPGESLKMFNARKWASRRERDPKYEGYRALKRKYGVTPEIYAEMLGAQGGVCAICKQLETKLDHKTHAPKVLSVDHCHETKKVRGLLCGRCNMTIGAAEHDPILLQKMIEYLISSEAAPTPALAEPHKIIIQTPDGPKLLAAAAASAGLKAKTVLARIRHGWPRDKWLQPLKKPKITKWTNDGEIL